MDLGITTYLFLVLNCILLVIGLIRMTVGICLIVSSVLVFFGIKDVTFSSIIGDSVFLSLNEGAVFLLGILAGLKNNIRLLYTETRRNETVIREDARLFLENLMNEYRLRRGRAENVDSVQNLFHCCGLDGPQFWYKRTDTVTNKTESTLLPSSCCFHRELVCVEKDAWKSGCISSVNARISKSLIDIHYYTSFPVFEILLLIFGAVLIIFIKKTAANSLA